MREERERKRRGIKRDTFRDRERKKKAAGSVGFHATGSETVAVPFLFKQTQRKTYKEE